MADPLRVGIAFALSDVAETLIIAGLIERYFGAEFRLDRLRHACGSRDRDLCFGNRRGCCVRAATISNSTGCDNLGALGRIQHNWLHCGCTAADWTRRCASAAAAEQ